jgi:parvulin-like peptidyl-prolyl isomerase
LFVLAAAAVAAADAPATTPPPPAAAFARVGEVTISRQEYEAAVVTAARNKFYHGAIPESEIAKLRRDVGERVVNDVLLLREAKRRQFVAASAAIQKTLDGYDARYKGNPDWQKQRSVTLTRLRQKLDEENVVAQLEAAVRKVPEPKASEVETYYAAHPDKFTQPEQVRISLILLSVDASSPKAKWDAARDEAAAIIKRLNAGADFAQLANLHSGDASATKGGDLGFVHRGVLPESAQGALDRLKPGQLSDPVTMLEGVAVLRLDDRKPAQLNPLAAVSDRARDLLRREQSDTAWSALIVRLRKETPPDVNEAFYVPVLAAGAIVVK